jgi:hypothetical protein
MSRADRVLSVAEKGNGSQGRFSLLDGSTFTYTTREGRAEALAQCEAYADHLQEVIENRIGRKLLPTEGNGLRSRPAMDARTTANQNAKWRDILEGPAVVQENDPVSIAKRRLERYENEQEQEADPKLYAIKADLRKAEQTAKDKEDKAAMLQNKAYASALSIAKQQLFNARFSPDCSEQVVSDCQGLVDYLSTGKADFNVALDQANAIKEQIKTAVGIKVQANVSLIAQHEREVAELRKTFSLPEAQNVTVDSTVDTTV